jgi:16S rRNA (cytosine1402-N4)-methyltransferase
MGHQPVLRDRVVDYLLPALEHGGTVVDATLGRGGHARRILEASPEAFLIGIDRDAEALDASRTNLAPYEGRFVLVRDDFKNLAAVLERLGHASVRGVLLDLGVSSPQLDEAARGFSYRHNGPLDMRMDTSQSLTAADVVNGYSERDLTRVIQSFGEERFARRIARSIAAARPISDTNQLADVVKAAIPAATRRTGGHPAKRTFQALRLEVNGELTALEAALPAAVDALEEGGRIAVLSYHSLEDRRVKHAFRDESRGCICPPDFPVCRCGAEPRLRLVTRKSIVPSAEEIEANPRAKSARLRVAERVGAA